VEKNKRRSKSQSEWEADPQKHKFVVQYAKSGKLETAAKASNTSVSTAKSWTGDQRFHIALRRILSERNSGLDKAARVIDEAMDAVRTRIDKQGNEIDETDHKTRLIAAKLNIEIWNAMPPKGEEQEEPDDKIFEDVVIDVSGTKES